MNDSHKYDGSVRIKYERILTYENKKNNPHKNRLIKPSYIDLLHKRKLHE